MIIKEYSKKHKKMIVLRREIHKSTAVFGEINTSLWGKYAEGKSVRNMKPELLT